MKHKTETIVVVMLALLISVLMGSVIVRCSYIAIDQVKESLSYSEKKAVESEGYADDNGCEQFFESVPGSPNFDYTLALCIDELERSIKQMEEMVKKLKG